jgi:hypothetical protein
MSERTPMLTDSEAQVLSPYTIEDESYYAWNEGAEAVRDYYEKLIVSGRLRAVEEVELWHPSVPEEEWRKWLVGTEAEFVMLVTKCCARNPWCPPWGYGKERWDEGKRDVIADRKQFVCPGCGNPIKRDA